MCWLKPDGAEKRSLVERGPSSRPTGSFPGMETQDQGGIEVLKKGGDTVEPVELFCPIYDCGLCCFSFQWLHYSQGACGIQRDVLHFSLGFVISNTCILS
jgi:hypothetical protein